MLGVTIVETKIPVPWGHISAKVWGNANDKPVLVFHGAMDNAGSFDLLIPLLPQSFYYICIDLPGHGLSSHFPAHVPIFSLSYVIVYKLIADYLKRKRYIIMGHSYGAQISVVFSQLYPQYVEKLILLDSLTFFPVLPKIAKSYLVDRFEHHLALEEKLANTKPPTYAYDEALDKILMGRYFPITNIAAIALSHRAIVQMEDGRYMFTLDQRMKNFINPQRDIRYTLDTFKIDPIQCPVLIILAKKSKALRRYLKPIPTYLRNIKNIKIRIVDGYHDVHIDDPEIVAPHISAFLLRKKAKL